MPEILFKPCAQCKFVAPTLEPKTMSAPDGKKYIVSLCKLCFNAPWPPDPVGNMLMRQMNFIGNNILAKMEVWDGFFKDLADAAEEDAKDA